METGFQLDDKGTSGTKPGTVDGLPIRGGERTDIGMEDTYGNQLIFDEGLYVNRIRDVDPGTQQDIYYLDLASREYFANEQTRVLKRYEGSISQNVESILKDVLEIEGEIGLKPINTVNIKGNDAKQLLELLEKLEEHEDIQKVYSNFDLDESDMEYLL